MSTPGVMFNAYPESIGQRLADVVGLLQGDDFRDCFSLFYILPTFFRSDLDGGFSIIDYTPNPALVDAGDLEKLKGQDIGLMFDLVLNHLSVASPQFRDLLEKGEQSAYRDFFIDWNDFWQGHGERGPDGVMVPNDEHLNKLFMRKPGLPVLKVPFPDGTSRFYWNTFYQQVTGDGLLGQMDLNGKAEAVWAFYQDTLTRLRSYGAGWVRLDAFAYLDKEVGEANFFNTPGTWQALERLADMAAKVGLSVLPEIHTEHRQGLHAEVAARGYPFYDFFLPGLLIDALDRGSNVPLVRWIQEILTEGYETVNMLGCHDGIPVLDLRGLLNDQEIDDLINRIVERGGRVKDLYGPDGKRVSYYQVNATYFSALGEDPQKLLLARAIQMFMPGIPQVWYLDLFAGKNNHEAVKRAGPGGHKAINRTVLSLEEVQEGINDPLVQQQLDLIRLRNTHPAFRGSLEVVETPGHQLRLVWRHRSAHATLTADLQTSQFDIKTGDPTC